MRRLSTAVLVLVGLGVSAAYAQTASVSVIGGGLWVTPADVIMSVVTPEGIDHTMALPAGTNTWAVQDGRGTGAGWSLTIRSAGSDTDKVKLNVRLLDTDIAVVAGNTRPTSLVTSMIPIPKAPDELTLVSADAGTGMGRYLLNPSFELDVPSTPYAQTYTATVTVTVGSGP